MSESTIRVDFNIGEKEVIHGCLTTASWEGGSGEPYAVLNIGSITIYSPSGADPTRDFLVALRDEINKMEQEIPVVEVAE